MSDSEEENFYTYGTPLEPFEEDEIPSKRPISIEDQIATDSHGRRRFHGAFTGGFSAGFCNTVGSLEGWKPTQFKSSRSSKAEKTFQKPEDFMDEEDVAEYGIAPQGLRPTDDYNSVKTSRKRRMPINDGPIPGQPVLQLLLEPVKETIGVKLLKQMNWKPGQGVGPRLTRAEKKTARKRMIGCAMPPDFQRKYSSESEEEEDSDSEITFAPDDYQPYICIPKENTSGLGYVGLNKNPVLSGFSQAKEPSSFTLIDRNNKKLSIQGQAFGVGAFEEDDEDIYSKEDMSKYDFELGEQKSQKLQQLAYKTNVFDNFKPSTKPRKLIKQYPPPILPKNFIPKHGVRISRFEPLPEEKVPQSREAPKVGRHALTAEERSVLIEERPKVVNKVISTESGQKIKILGGGDVPLSDGKFKPFVANPDKQERYEKYLEFVQNNEKEKLKEIQPISMTEWDRERERAEFEQAAKMYKPRTTDFLVFDRFVSAQQTDDVNNPLATVESLKHQHGTADMRAAAKMKMFGKLTREVTVWIPCSLLCKRFNVPEPHSISVPKNQKKKRNFSVFDYLNAADNIASNSSNIKQETEENMESIKNKLKSVSNVNKNELQSNKLTEIDLTESESNQNSVEVPSASNSNELNIMPSISKTNESLLGSSTSSSSKSLIEKSNNENESVIQNLSSSINLKEKLPIPSVSNTSENNSENEKPGVPEESEIVLHTDEKIDLYKEIFLSSSESENESDDEKQDKDENKTNSDGNSKEKQFKEDLIKDIEIQKAKLNENIADFPLAPVAVSSGIFSNIDFDSLRRKPVEKQPEKITETEPEKQIEKEPEEQQSTNDLNPVEMVDAYGPKLPEVKKADQSRQHYVFSRKTVERLQSDLGNEREMWVEKKVSSKKSKKEDKEKVKKHKKHKKSSKKHKKRRRSDSD